MIFQQQDRIISRPHDAGTISSSTPTTPHTQKTNQEEKKFHFFFFFLCIHDTIPYYHTIPHPYYTSSPHSSLHHSNHNHTTYLVLNIKICVVLNQYFQNRHRVTSSRPNRRCSSILKKQEMKNKNKTKKGMQKEINEKEKKTRTTWLSLTAVSWAFTSSGFVDRIADNSLTFPFWAALIRPLTELIDFKLQYNHIDAIEDKTERQQNI